jgi:hypothetical protein
VVENPQQEHKVIPPVQAELAVEIAIVDVDGTPESLLVRSRPLERIVVRGRIVVDVAGIAETLEVEGEVSIPRTDICEPPSPAEEPVDLFMIVGRIYGRWPIRVR